MDEAKFLELCKPIAALVGKKNKDYNNAVSMEQYFAFGHMSFIQMERTKILRLTSLVMSNEAPNFESILDTIRDLVAYSVFHLDFAQREVPGQAKVLSDNLRSVQTRFHAAKNRCTNKKNAMYKYYGARGIKFLFTSMDQLMSELGPCPDGFVLDRKNNDGNYEPGNVRWATVAESNHNKRPRCAGASKVKGVAQGKSGFWVAYSDGNAKVRKSLYNGKSLAAATKARKAWEKLNTKKKE